MNTQTAVKDFSSQSAARSIGLQVDIHGGIHDGANSSIENKQISIIGSAADCDIRLTDLAIAAHHIAIGLSGERFVVRPMDGGCAVNGKRVRTGQSESISSGDRIDLDGTDVWIAIAKLQCPAEDNGESALKTASTQPRLTSRPTLYVGVALLAISVAFGGQMLLSKDAPAMDAAIGIADVLQSLEIENDVDVTKEAGRVTIRGVLPDEKSSALEVSLQALPRNIINRTQSVGRLLEQVRSVFRTNGYHAELTYVGDGSVEVTNLDGENTKIQQVAVRARDDIAILTALTFAPVNNTDRSGRGLAIYSTDPNKRLTTIIDGDTAYVATTDGGRYFVGSVLPGGLVLRDISAEGIQVDDNGEIHWLAL